MRYFGCLLTLVIFLVPAWAGGWVFDRADVTATGIQADNDCLSSSISGDGRFVAFDSAAYNLVPGVMAGSYQCYVKDRVTGTLECVSLNSAGQPANGQSNNSSISWDGRFVAFVSFATNLAPVDPSALSNVFVYDRLTKTVELMNVTTTGVPGNENAILSSISGDGRFVTFSSYATNLVPFPAVSAAQVYVHDRVTGTTEVISLNNAGEPADDSAGGSGISGDGRWVAYGSIAGNLVPGVAGPPAQVYLFDRVTQTVQCVSVNAGGIPGNNTSLNPNVNEDGSVVVFNSTADNLVSSDINGTFGDVFVFNKLTGVMELASKDLLGVQHPFFGVNSPSMQAVSSDGNKVTYALGWPSPGQVYLWDRTTDTRVIISEDSGGVIGNGGSAFPTISRDGNCVVFRSFATNLLVPDDNGGADIYITCLNPPIWPTDTLTTTPTPSPTESLTPIPTASATGTTTDTPTHQLTSTPTSTPTIATPTPDCRDGRPVPPIIYPNPAKDRVVVQVRSSLCRNIKWMKIKIYTTSYRKLAEISLGPQAAGVLETPMELRDGHGTVLADGLYYMVVETPFERNVGKLLVAR